MLLFLCSLGAICHASLGIFYGIPLNCTSKAPKNCSGNYSATPSLHFTREPKSLTFLNSITSRIPCQVEGRPKPSISWITESGSMVNNVRDLRSVLADGTLLFYAFSENAYSEQIHNAKYRCRATSTMGTLVSKLITVKAVIDRRYSPRVQHQTAILGGSAAFKCIVPDAVSKFVRTISWKIKWRSSPRNDFLAVGSSNNRFHALPMSGHLLIERVQALDRDLEVSCTTKNDLNRVALSSASARLFVQDLSPSRLQIKVYPLNQVVKTGETAILSCLASSYPLPEYTWTKSNIPLVATGSVQKVLNGTMVIKSITTDHGGSYECIIRKGGSIAKRIKINVLVREPIDITEAPKTELVPVGDTARFACRGSGNPAPSITWLQNGRPIGTGNRRRKIQNVQGKSILSLYAATSIEQGIYQCVVRNRYEEKLAAARLVVGATRPKIKKGPGRQVLDQDLTVLLSCTVSGSPLPSVTWLLDGKKIGSSKPRYSTAETIDSSGGLSSTLTIEGLRVTDGGRYTCEAGNRAGWDLKVGEIAVKGPPKITNFPDKVTAVSGNKVYLNCVAKGYPLPVITWYNNGYKLARTGDKHSILENGTLVFSVIDKSKDQSRYICIATNNAGTHEKSLQLIVSVPPTIMPFNWPQFVTGHRAVLSCTVQTGDLPITITWHWNGKELTNSVGMSIHQLEFSSSVSFRSVTTDHRGRYNCVAENRAGKASQSAEFIVLEPPTITKQPLDTSVLQSNLLKLECRASGFPTPQITWYKAKIRFRYEPVNLGHLISQDGNGTLTIQSVTAKDAGKYVCSAANGVGAVIRKVATVDVKIPAKVNESSSQVLKQRKGESTSFYCSATGTPPLQLVWYKGTRRLSAEGSYKYRAHVTVNKDYTPAILNETFYISNLERSDNDYYSCQTTNSFGGGSKRFQILVQEKPDPPSPPSSTRTSSRSINVKWTPGFDGNCEILSYDLEYKQVEELWSSARSFVFPGNKTIVTVADLSPGCSYSFRVKAKNILGVSGYSTVSTLRTREEAPSAAPRNLTVIVLSKDSIRVRWKAPRKRNQNGVLNGYYITYFPTYMSGKFLQNITVRNVEEHVIRHLFSYERYSVKIQAFTRAGVGPLSPTVRIRTMEGAPTAPPRNILVESITSQSIRIQWHPPLSASLHGKLRGHKVIYEEVKTSKVMERVVQGTLHYTELTNLLKFSRYRIKVLAFTGGGDGVASQPVVVRTAEDSPGPPQNLRAAPSSPNEIMVTWDLPTHTNGNINGFILYYRKSKDTSSSQHEISLRPTKRSHLIQSLDVGKEYEIWMTASTSVGVGKRTAVIKTRTMTRIPASILTPLQTIKVRIHGHVNIPCVAVGHPNPRITWTFKHKKLFRRRKRAVYSDGNLRLSDVKLKDAGPYNCSAVNSFGTDWNIITLVVQAPPAPPELDSASRFNKSALNVTWVPGYDGKSAITKYHVKYKTDEKDDWSLSVVPASKTWMVFKNSKNRTYIKVAAKNGIGIGKYSKTVEVIVTKNGLVVLLASKNKPGPAAQPTGLQKNEENETIVGPIVAGVIVAIVIVLLLFLLASWDRTERKMRSPRCYRLALCGCGGDTSFLNQPYHYDGPYGDSDVPWPWNIASNRNSRDLDMTDTSYPHRSHREEERFPEHLFAELMRFDSVEEEEAHNQAAQTEDVMSSPEKSSRAESHNYNSQSSSTVYKTSHSSELAAKLVVSGKSIVSSGQLPSTDSSERGIADGKSVDMKDYGNDEILSDGPYSTGKHAKLQKPPKRLRQEGKSLDSGLHNESIKSREIIRMYTGRKRSQDSSISHDIRLATAAISMITDSKGRRSRGSMSYDSISSNCSSTRGELVRAYEFGKKYRLQEYHIPHVAMDSTTEESCSEWDDLCEFSSLPRDSNDCHVHMPIPVKCKDVLKPYLNGNIPVMSLQDPYDGESLV